MYSILLNEFCTPKMRVYKVRTCLYELASEGMDLNEKTLGACISGLALNQHS